MRRFTLCLLLALVSLCGCNEEKTAVDDEPLVPDAQELHTLKAYHLEVDSPRGQRKIRQIRERREKIEAIRAYYQELAEEKRRREGIVAGSTDNSVEKNRIDQVLRGQ